jgi:hypothetical protein
MHPGKKLVASRNAPHTRVGVERIHVEFRQWIEAGRLGCRPVHFIRADPDLRAVEQDEIDGMIVMSVCQDDIGHVSRTYAQRAELLCKMLANTKRADINQDRTLLRAEQRDGAPPEAAVTDRLPWIALHKNIDLIHGPSLRRSRTACCTLRS